MLKRIFDIVLSLIGIVILLPVFLIVTGLIYLLDGGPALFTQVRVGRYGKLFKILKFRTMTIQQVEGSSQITVGADSRVYPLGKLLRSCKLDETPQLINVLLGEMSFVGPRPEVEKYVKMYSEAQRDVLKFRPGITDPASILFRNESEVLASFPDPERAYVENIMPKKLTVNQAYISKANVVRDMRVIVITLLAIIFPEKKWKF